ncbi:hypothetical protein Tco_1440079 [Tanacetum coccineum]
MSSSLAVTSSGLSFDVLDAGLPSEKESSRPVAGVRVNSGSGDGLPERLASQVLLEWSVPWQLPIVGSCQARCWKVIETFFGYALHTIEWNFYFLFSVFR